MINSVVLRPGNLHQYPVLSCGKDLHDYHITKNFSGIFILSYYFLRKKNIVQSCLNQFINHHIICFFSYRMAEATTSRYESNYIKIAMVVLRVSPRAVRVQFDKGFDPVCLQGTLKSQQSCLSDLQTKKRITQPQWDLLFPKTGRLLYLFCCFLEQVGYYICFA